jgi:hypothetical protein
MTAKQKAENHIKEQKEKNKFVPVLLPQTWGNAEKLIWYTTLDHRSEYWLVLVDADSDIESIEFSYIAENEISNAIEEEFGEKYNSYCECDNCKNGNDCDGNPYPALSYHGCSLGVLD